MEDKKDGQQKGFSIDGDVGYSEVRQDIDDHSTHSSSVVNDSSIHDHSSHKNTTVHDQSTRQVTTNTVTKNDSSVRDHSSHVKTENIYMGDRHNPLFYILPIVLVAVAAIGAIVLVVNKKEDKPAVQVVQVSKPVEKAIAPAPSVPQPVEHSETKQNKPVMRGIQPSRQQHNERTETQVITAGKEVSLPIHEETISPPEVPKPARQTPPKLAEDENRKQPPPVQQTPPERPAPAITILPVNDHRARQGETFSFSLLMNGIGSACGTGKSTAELKKKALAGAKQKVVTMSSQYLAGRYEQIRLKKPAMKNVRVVKVYKSGKTKNGCYQVDMLAEMQLYSGSLSAGDEKALLEDPIAPLHLRVWTDKRIYSSGEEMHVFVKGNKPFYARILYLDASGNQVQILPNNFRPSHSFQGGAIYSIPDGNDEFSLEISPPFGKEEIIVYASTVPLGTLKKQDVGGIYLVESSKQNVAQKMRGIKIKKAKPLRKQNRTSQNTKSPIAEFFEGHAHLTTRGR